MKRPIPFFVAILLLFAGCGIGDGPTMAPDFETQLVDGTPFKLSQLKGSYVVLDVWGSWCGPCIHEIPELVALHQKYGDRVAFVSVALEKNDRTWEKVAERFGFSWKFQIVEEAPFVLSSSIARAFGVTEIPAKFIITPEGKLISGMDYQQMDEFLGHTVL